MKTNTQHTPRPRGQVGSPFEFMKTNTCPICRKPIQKGEKLLAEYLPEQDWWIVLHIKAGQQYDGDIVGKTTSCASAGFALTEKPHPMDNLLSRVFQ